MKNNIRELRTALSLTQSELAQQLGLNQSAIGKYERGELEPSISTLKKMSFIFECSIDYIIGNADDFGNIVIKEKSPAPALTQAEQDLLDDFRSVPRPEQAQIAEYAHYVADKHATHKQQSIKKNA